MPSARALACPASLKGVLSAREAAAALAEGLRTWTEADALPLADGGEGSLEALYAAIGGVWRRPAFTTRSGGRGRLGGSRYRTASQRSRPRRRSRWTQSASTPSGRRAAGSGS